MNKFKSFKNSIRQSFIKKKPHKSDTNEVGGFDEFIESAENGVIPDDVMLINFKKVIDVLKGLKEEDYKSNKVKDYLDYLQNFSNFSPSDTVLKQVIDYGLYKICLKIIEYLLRIDAPEHQNMAAIFACFVPISQRELIAKENAKHTLFEKAIHILGKENYLSEENINNNELCELYDTTIGFLYNNSRCYDKCKEIQEAFTRIDLKNVIFNELSKLGTLNYERNYTKYIKVNLINTLVLISSYHELESRLLVDDIIKTLINMSKDIIGFSKTNEERRFHSVCTKYYAGYKIINISTICAASCITSLAKLALNDSIKQKLANLNVASSLLELLINGNIEEQEVCCDFICSLCFTDAGVKQVKQDVNLMSSIKDIQEKSNNISIKMLCQQIIEMINKSLDTRIATAAAKVQKGYVFISYYSKYKEQCNKMCDDLKKKGYKALINNQNEYFNLQEDMANKIEQSSNVFICYSSEYATSNYCRFEAEYIIKINKPVIGVKMQAGYEPDGWLNALLASKTQFDLSNPSNGYSNFIKQLQQVLKEQVDEKVFVKPNKSPITIELTNPVNWHTDQVKAWLISNNMKDFANSFKTLTGLGLKTLYEIKQIDYVVLFYFINKEIEENKYNIDFNERVVFYQHLQNLFETTSTNSSLII